MDTCPSCDWPDDIGVGERCPQCREVMPEPPDDLPPESWEGGFADNH